MIQKQYTEYFLGANTPNGFRSFFETACPVSDGWSIYVIKGGPGSGKSTLMRHAGKEALKHGLNVEHIYCSSDPDSLDGLIIPSIKTALFDGTAPHIIEPRYPGACEHIIALGDAWSKARLRAQRDQIISLAGTCSAHHSQATRFLSCADSFRQSTISAAKEAMDSARTLSTAARIMLKYCGKAHIGTGKETLRLISSVTPKGVISFSETLQAQCEKIVPVIDRYYAPSMLLMNELRRLLLEHGHEIIVCCCSQCYERIEHIIVRNAGIGFTVCSDIHAHQPRTERAVHTERFLDSKVLAESRHTFATNRRNISFFTELASEEMRHAKAVHDQLEQCYISSIDFDRISEISEKVCRDIFS